MEGSFPTDPSQKAQIEFNEKFILRSDHNKVVDDKNKQIDELKDEKVNLKDEYEQRLKD